MSIKKNNITSREKEVLKAVVEDFIISNVPIGSNILKKKHPFNCSPATLRNAMASLEKKNLLMHMHTSSGRVPSDVGYRYYVDNLMEQTDQTLSEYDLIQAEINKYTNNVEALMKTTAAMLSKISHLFGVAMILQYDRSILNEIELVSLSSDRVMVVLGMKTGLVRSIVLNLKVSIKENELHDVSSVLKEKLLGLTLIEIINTIGVRLKESPLSEHEIIQILLHHSEEYFSVPDNQMVFTSSSRELLDQPEYQQVENLQQTLIAVDNENVCQYFKTYLNKQNNYMLIGNENMEDIYNNCTIVTNVFNGFTFKGQIGIIGPTRLPYARILKILNNFTEIMKRVC